MIQDKNYIDDECYGYARCSKKVQDAEYEIKAFISQEQVTAEKI